MIREINLIAQQQSVEIKMYACVKIGLKKVNKNVKNLQAETHFYEIGTNL